MATVVVTLKIMPEGPDTDLDNLTNVVSEKITAFGGTVGKKDTEPIAFGLKSLLRLFSMPEDKGGTEELEKMIEQVPGVRSVQVSDVRRTVG